MKYHASDIKTDALDVNATTNRIQNSSSISLPRRRVLTAVAAAGALAVLDAPAVLAQDSSRIRIGYWPVSSGLPFYAAYDMGYFKDAGLNVEALKFASAQQVIEGMIAGRAEGSANGVASGVLAVGELAQPGLFKIYCTNQNNAKYVLDTVLVAADSQFKSIADLKGKRFACSPGVQNVTIAKTILEKAGAGKMNVTELPIAQHIASLVAGQIDGVYTLEPTGTIGRLNGTTRTLESAVVSKYILGDSMAPWHGGAGSLTTEFITRHPDLAKRYVAAYARGVELIRKQPAVARPHLKGHTAIEGPLVDEVPMSEYLMYNEFKSADLAYFQKFYDLFSDRGVFDRRVLVGPLMYKG